MRAQRGLKKADVFGKTRVAFIQSVAERIVNDLGRFPLKEPLPSRPRRTSTRQFCRLPVPQVCQIICCRSPTNPAAPPRPNPPTPRITTVELQTDSSSLMQIRSITRKLLVLARKWWRYHCSTSSSDSEDDMFYINQLMQAATINKVYNFSTVEIFLTNLSDSISTISQLEWSQASKEKEEQSMYSFMIKHMNFLSLKPQ